MLALALALSLATTGGYRLVLTDSSWLLAAAPPRIADNGLVVADLGDGQLVSLPASRIDWPATEAANRLPPAADAGAGAAAAAAPPGSPVRRPPPPPPPQQQPVITNRTIEDFARAIDVAVPTTGAAAAVSTAAPGPPARPPVSPLPQLDDRGRGPAYWRERAATLRDQTRLAEGVLRAARESLATQADVLLHGRRVAARGDGFGVTRFGQSAEELAVIELRLSQLEERVRLAEEALEIQRQREADLREEARLSGADPGWLRLPVAYR